MRPIPVAFHIGPLEVHTYGIGLAITFWFAYLYFEKRLQARGYRTEWFAGVFIWVIVAAVVGARAMHVLATLKTYTSNPAQVFQIWHGGLSSFGGLILAVPTGIYLTHRRCPELKLSLALDIVAPVLAASWALGRLLGPQLMVQGGGHPTNQWFGMYYATQIGKRLPVPLFQSAEDFFIFLILIYVDRRFERANAKASRSRSGMVIGVGMILWGIERAFDQHFWLASTSGKLGSELVQLAGLALVVGGTCVVIAVSRRLKLTRPNDPDATPDHDKRQDDTSPRDLGAAADSEEPVLHQGLKL